MARLLLIYLERALARRVLVNFPRLTRADQTSRSYMRTLLSVATAGLLLAALPAPICAQVNVVGQKPYLGWGTFSETDH